MKNRGKLIVLVLFLLVVIVTVILLLTPEKTSKEEKLLIAIKNNNIEMVKKLIDEGVNLNFQATRSISESYFEAVVSRGFYFFQYRGGYRLAVFFEKGETPLCLAIKNQDHNIIELLIQKGIN